MRIRRLPQVVVVMTTLIAPLTSLAQLSNNGSVTTAPLANAPVMGTPTLLLLAIVLVGAAAYLLRRAAGRGIAVISFLAVLTGLAGLGYAMIDMITIQGAQCSTATTQMFDPFEPTTLVSRCPNSIQVTSIQLSCALGDRTEILNFCSPLPGVCTVGQVLDNGDSCTLPGCIC